MLISTKIPRTILKEGIEWERPIHIELYERNGERAFSEKAGIRIHGGVNRQSFKIL